MTSKLTRERIELIANFHRAMALPPSHAEIEELARIALAAMDSESGCLPLDYLQGHKDGLEFASQLAKPITLRPETGFTMTLSSWQKLFAKAQICRQRSRQRTASRIAILCWRMPTVIVIWRNKASSQSQYGASLPTSSETLLRSIVTLSR